MPPEAVSRLGQLEFAQVVDASGRAASRLVTTGRSDEQGVEVLSGLRAGERVPFVTAWIGFLSALAWCAVGIIKGEYMRMLMQCAVPSIAAAILSVGARRHARRLRARERVRVDEAVKELVGELYDAEIVLPQRRSRGRRQRRRRPG